MLVMPFDKDPRTDLEWADLIVESMSGCCETYIDGHVWNLEGDAVPKTLEIVKSIRNHGNATTSIVFYDVAIEGIRQATQDDWDRLFAKGRRIPQTRD